MWHDASLSSTLFLLAASVFAGVLNGVAGGGGLIVFPALLLTGVSPVHANATNAAALWFGTTASSIAYRRELNADRPTLIGLSLISLVGGVLGSFILLRLPSNLIAQLVPYLLLTATLLFAFGQPLLGWLKRRGSRFSRLPLLVSLPLQLAIATYGGFFGGGGGILMLALLELMGIRNLHVMNAFKSWLASCLNGAAIVYFALAGAILWPQTLLMAIGASLGGYGSAYFARRIDPAIVRWLVIGVGTSLTLYFFLQE